MDGQDFHLKETKKKGSKFEPFFYWWRWRDSNSRLAHFDNKCLHV